MKKYTTFLAAAAVIVLSSCEGLFNPDKSGLPIRFGATAENGMNPLTKTAYSGDDIGGKERIDWEAEDEILISMYYYDENGGNGTTDLKQYSIVNIQPDGFKSVAQVAAVGEPLIWGSGNTYHRFVGIYPSSYGGEFSDGGRWNGSTIKFNLPDIQDGGMDYAYMAAITGYYTPSEKATLDFYPMVTTLYFTLVNDTKEEQEVRRIELEQKEYYGAPLVGKYTVEAKAEGQFSPWEYNWENGSQKLILNINRQIPVGKSFSIPAFIIPSSRPTEKTYIDVIFPNKRLSNDLSNKKVTTFEACKKYNITVSLSGDGVVVNPPFDPEIPPIGDLSDGVAQVLAMMIKQVINDQNFVYELLKDFYDGKDNNWFNDNVWNNKFIHIFDSQSNLNDITIDDLIEIFGSEDAVKTLLRYIRENVTTVSMTETPKIACSLTGKDLQTLFPNATSVFIQVAQEGIPEERLPITIDVDTLPYLQSLTIEYAQIVTITNCEQLSSVSFPNPTGYFTGATITGCPGLN